MYTESLLLVWRSTLSKRLPRGNVWDTIALHRPMHPGSCMFMNIERVLCLLRPCATISTSEGGAGPIYKNSVCVFDDILVIVLHLQWMTTLAVEAAHYATVRVTLLTVH